MDSVSEEKRCSKCKETKPRTEFTRSKASKDGLYSWCKGCSRAAGTAYTRANAEANRARARAWSAANRERVRTVAKQRYQKYPQEYKQRAADWAKEHPERRREIRMQSQQRRREKKAVSNQRWRRANPQNVTAANHRRRWRKHGQHFTAKEWRDLRERYGNKCLCCGSTKRITVDHVVPLVAGGSNTIDNIQPLCWTCNRRKWAKTIDYRPLHLQNAQLNMRVFVQEQLPLDVE